MVSQADLLHALAVVGLGAIGWFALEFLGRPIREFFSLRREVRRLMLLHWDDESADERLLTEDDDFSGWRQKAEATRGSFSDAGARLGAFDQGEPVASWFVRRMGFNLPKAAGNLRHLGVEFGARGEDRKEKFRKIDAALKFKINPNKRTIYSPHNVGR